MLIFFTYHDLGLVIGRHNMEPQALSLVSKQQSLDACSNKNISNFNFQIFMCNK